MKKLIYICLSFIVIVTTSCSDYVEIEERGAATASSVTDLRLIMNGRLEFLNTERAFFSDDIGTLSQAAYLGASESFRRAYRFDDFLYNEAENDRNWSEPYGVIAKSNFVINQVDELPDPTGERDQVLGEALVHRAFAYFDLVNMYASNYTDATASTDLGVPLLTVFGDPSISLVRATVQEVYDLIISDLTQATALLFDVVNTPFKPNRPTAYGMLAKAYLQMGKYNLAKENAQQALGIYNSLLNYNNLSTFSLALNGDFVNLVPASTRPGEKNNPETIWHASNQVSTDIGLLLGGSVLPIGNPLVPLLATGPHTFVTDEILALGNPFDIRFSDMIFEVDGFIRSFPMGNFAEQQGYPLGVNVPELIFIQAESEARIGDYNTAMTQLNDFRATRFKNTAPAGSHVLTAANQAEAIQHVLDERVREFMYRGFRMFDIKRLNAHHNAGISATHVIPTDGSIVTLGPNDPKWNFAIPPKEIAISPELEQNPRN